MTSNLLAVNGRIAPETTKSRIRDKVRERIRLSGMSANEICKRAKTIDPGHLSRWLSGNSNMDLDRIEELAAALGTSLPELIADQAATSHIPVVALSRLPTTATRDSVLDAAKSAARDHMPNPTRYPDAFGVIGNGDPGLAVGEVGIAIPAHVPDAGNLVIATHGHTIFLARALRLGDRIIASRDGRAIPDAEIVATVTHVFRVIAENVGR